MPADSAYLADEALAFTETEEGGFLCVVIQDFPLPEGYDAPKINLLLRLPPGFPDAAPDMWWSDPPIRIVATGAFPQAADSMENHLGKVWQRFSRDFNGGQWQPNGHGLAQFVAVIRRDFARAVGLESY